MGDHFETNLELLAKQCPKLALFLPDVDLKNYKTCLTVKGELNLLREESFFYHSQSGAIDEAEALLRPFLNDKTEIIFVYGTGLAYPYFVAKNWLKQNPKRKIVFVEDDLGALKILIEMDRGREFLENNQVRLLVAKPEDLLLEKEGIEGLEILFTCTESRPAIVTLPSYLRKKPKESSQVIQGLTTLLFLYKERFKDLENPLLAPNFYLKLLAIPSSYQLKNMLADFSQIPCIIAGAGPSLEDEVDLIKTLEDRALIFAAGTGMNILNAHGIYPHFGGGVDPTEVQVNRIRASASFETPYFFTHRFSHAAFSEIHGPHIFTPQIPQTKWYAWFQRKLGIENPLVIQTGLSTSTFLTSIAKYVGCNPIVYLGIDLCYQEGRKYAKGAEIHPIEGEGVFESFQRPAGAAFPAVNFENKEFDTNLFFISESGWMRLYAEDNPQTTFFYASPEGLGVKGIERISLKDIAKKSFRRQYDLHNQIHAAIENSSYSSLKVEEIEKALQQWNESLTKCIALIRRILVGGSSVLIETELNEEDAYKYLLEDFEQAEMLKSGRQNRGYEKMLQVGLAHLKALEQLKLPFEKLPEKEVEQPQIFGQYSFKDGILKIVDPEMNIDFEERFHPISIPSSIRDIPEWKSHEPVGEVFAYSNALRTGECHQFYCEGPIKSRQYYLEDFLHGPSTFYSREGTVLGQTWYVRGKKEGKSLFYYLNGNIYSIERWYLGRREGKQEYFYPKGSLKTSLSFVHGLLHGEAKLYYPNGQLKQSINFCQGVRHGHEVCYHINGQRSFETEFNKNRPVGITRWFNEAGSLIKQTQHEPSC